MIVHRRRWEQNEVCSRLLAELILTIPSLLALF